MRKEGDAEAAKEVAKLRKPTVAAWLVNRLVQTERKAADRFFAAAEDLQRAQDEAVRGKGGDHLRRAAREEREAIEELVKCARRIGDGFGAATFDRVRETLEAAVTDEEAREAVRSGRLKRELRPGASMPSSPLPESTRDDEDDQESRRETELADAEQELETAQQELTEAEEEQERLQESVERAQSELRQAREDLKKARAAARKQAGAVRSAERRAQRLRDS
jgi:DNA repair exonuclease SbcCD ATPase subunit